ALLAHLVNLLQKSPPCTCARNQIFPAAFKQPIATRLGSSICAGGAKSSRRDRGVVVRCGVRALRNHVRAGDAVWAGTRREVPPRVRPAGRTTLTAPCQQSRAPTATSVLLDRGIGLSVDRQHRLGAG